MQLRPASRKSVDENDLLTSDRRRPKQGDSNLSKLWRATNGAREGKDISTGSLLTEQQALALQGAAPSADHSAKAWLDGVNWKLAQERAARTARWSITMTRWLVARLKTKTAWNLITFTGKRGGESAGI